MNDRTQLVHGAARVVWATPDIDGILGYIARVSNPDGQDNPNVTRLFNTMMREGHTSPFQMANVCVEINTTRDIGRQMLRHWTLMPQEFSQRYERVDKLGGFVNREFRRQHPTNRQMSLDVDPADPIALEWKLRQESLFAIVDEHYKWCLANGGAKEVARTILPEGSTRTRIYFNGPMRTWIFYLRERLKKHATQKEHRLIAEDIIVLLRQLAPIVIGAFFPEDDLK